MVSGGVWYHYDLTTLLLKQLELNAKNYHVLERSGVAAIVVVYVNKASSDYHKHLTLVEKAAVVAQKISAPDVLFTWMNW